VKRLFPSPGALLLAAAAAAVLCAAPFAGRMPISPAEAFDPAASPEYAVFWMLRVPRVMVSFLVGAALALCGMTFQALFRNPLATPFTLGVSSGASFGAALCMSVGAAVSLGGMSSVSLFAFGGACLAVLVVYMLSRVRKSFSVMTLLLAGVAVNFFFSALVLFLQYFADFVDSRLIVLWLMGGLNVVGFGPVWEVIPFCAAGGAVMLLHARELNLLSLGEEIAASRGVETGRVKKVLFFATSFTVGGVVAVAGPVGFVGMMVPHMMRRLAGADHRVLGPACILGGGIFLSACDTLARVVLPHAEIPVGVVTALLGGPFFLWLLLRYEE